LKPDLEKHSVKVQIPEKFPLVKVDFGLIEQAINNIIHNASVHTPENTEITIKVSYKNGILEIIISDNGPGFAKESIDDIYDRFYRTKPKKVGGLGLGLSISKGFISSHKGTLEIKNQVPHGAIFIIKIPVEITQLETGND
jgi:two-component system sensor histidine kinase KdpD